MVEATNILLPLMDLIIQTLKIEVEIFMWANSQKLDAVRINNPIREQAKLIDHPKFVHTNPDKITHFCLTNKNIADDCLYCCVKIGFLLTCNFLTVRSKVGVIKTRISRTGTRRQALPDPQ